MQDYVVDLLVLPQNSMKIFYLKALRESMILFRNEEFSDFL